jgi:hypothetical protein
MAPRQSRKDLWRQDRREQNQQRAIDKAFFEGAGGGRLPTADQAAGDLGDDVTALEEQVFGDDNEFPKPIDEEFFSPLDD